MTKHRFSILGPLLAVAFVAYPITMPTAMLGMETAAHSGSGCAPMHHAPGHGHRCGMPPCCNGVCCAAVVCTLTAAPAPALRRAVVLTPPTPALPPAVETSPLKRLPFSIGPPPAPRV